MGVMENTAIVLIVITLFLLVIILGLLTALVYRLFKQNPTAPIFQGPSRNESETHGLDISRSEFHPAIIDRLKEMEKIRPAKKDLFCPNHRDEPGEVTCAICDKLFCRACIKPFKTMHFCKEHLPLIMRYDWEEVLTLKTSTHDPEAGVRLYDAKKVLFEKEDIPTYIETHYKINVDQDYIETYLVMFGIKERVPELKKKLEEFTFNE